jgi:hypothetical protein
VLLPVGAFVNLVFDEQCMGPIATRRAHLLTNDLLDEKLRVGAMNLLRLDVCAIRHVSARNRRKV